MRRPLLFIALSAYVAAVALTGAGPAAATDHGIYFNVRDLGQLGIDAVADELADARVVVIGEHHGDREHHVVQLEIIKALAERGRKVAVGLEMFRGDAQDDLDRWTAGTLSPEDFYAVYVDNWAPSYWWIYTDIFSYAREKSFPLLGLNMPRSTVKSIAAKGYAGISDELRATIPEVRCEVSSTYRQFLQDLTRMKETKNGTFERFCEAQVLWDTVMAKRTVDFIKANPGTVVVILAGNFHAWKHGVAAQVERLSDLPVKVILPSRDQSVFRYEIFLKDADYVWWPKEALE